MSIRVIGFSSGGALLLPLITVGVHTIGWRDVMLYSGIFMGLVVVPLASVIQHSPERMGLLPDGAKIPVTSVTTRSQEDAAPTLENNADFTVKQALRTSSYWILLAATVLRITLWGAISLHAVEMMVWKGMPRETAGLMFSLMFMLSIPLRLGAGILGDRFPLQPLMRGGMVSAALAVLAMLLMVGNWGIYLFIMLMALEQGGSTLNWLALGNFFGRAKFGTLMGIISTCFNVGMLASPIYAGWLFDRTNSYTWVLVTFLPMYLISGILFLVVKKPPLPKSRTVLAAEPVT